MSDEKEEETFREFLTFRFDTLEAKIESYNKIVHKRIDENRDNVSLNAKKLISLDKRTIILTIIVSVFYNNLLEAGTNILKRFIP